MAKPLADPNTRPHLPFHHHLTMKKHLKPTHHLHHQKKKATTHRLLLILLLLLPPICLYLLFSSSSSPIHLPTSTTLPSLALLERPSTIPPLRIYVYDLPSSYNADWLSANPRCESHLFASEVALHRSILSSPFCTRDPSSADLFLVPVYVSCNFSTRNGFPSVSHARSLLSSAVSLLSSLHPFWNRSSGSDHVFVASHDHGACFHALDSSASSHGIPLFLRRSIVLQTFGVHEPHPCQEIRHVVIPPYIPVDDHLLRFEPALPRRDIFAFFRGKMEVHPKNVSGYFYGNGVRTEIWRRYAGDRRFYLRRKRGDGYREEMGRSVFCLCPRGWAPWSPRVVEAVAFGCVPVVIADGIRLPFPEAVPWERISLSIPEGRVAEMGRVLGHVARTNLTAIQRRLWGPEVRRALLYHRRMRTGDATWHVIRNLARMVGRSARVAGE